jgi:hypothetical protein
MVAKGLGQQGFIDLMKKIWRTSRDLHERNTTQGGDFARQVRVLLKTNGLAEGAHRQDTAPHTLVRTEGIGRETGVMAPPVRVRSKCVRITF